RYVIHGVVEGLDGKDLVLESRSGGVTDSVTLNANGQFAFPMALPLGAAYDVRVKQNPTENWQTCVVTRADADNDGGAGDAGDAGADDAGAGIIDGDVTDLRVRCTTNTYPISAHVVGLDAS